MEPRIGDHIYCKDTCRHGIYSGKGEVIHLSISEQESQSYRATTISKSKLEIWSKKHNIEIINYDDNLNPLEKSIHRARQLLRAGIKKHNFFYNNSKNFAIHCRTGDDICNLTRGDHIKVSRNWFYDHHGIFESRNSVINFCDPNLENKTSTIFNMLKRKKGKIMRHSLERFLDGKQLLVAKYQGKTLHPEETIKKARAHIGDENYSILFNNCEHFATYCKTGEKKSRQVKKGVWKFIGTTVGIILVWMANSKDNE